MWSQKPNFRFEIDNFLEKETTITSKTFWRGGCEWFLSIYPKGDSVCDDHLSLYLSVANRKSLPTGWKRSALFYFVVLNQSEKELARSPISQGSLFCAESPSWGFRKTMPLSKFQKAGFLDKERLIIDIYIKDVEFVVDGEGGNLSEKKKTVDINDLKDFPSKVASLTRIFAKYPNIENNLELPNNQTVKTADTDVSLVKQLGERVTNLEQMDLNLQLLSLKSGLEKLSLEKNKASVDWSRVDQLEERVENFELMKLEKLDSLKKTIDEVSLEIKKSDDVNESRSQNLEERVENIELMELESELECLNRKFKEISMERKSDVSRFQQFEKRVNDLEAMELESELESLNTKLEEVSQERETDESKLIELRSEVDDLNAKVVKVSLARKNDESRFQKFEERVKDLEVTAQAMSFKLVCLNTKLEKDSLERKKSDVADEARVQELEESVKDLKLMVLHLKAELDKKKDKSSADGFLLVD